MRRPLFLIAVIALFAVLVVGNASAMPPGIDSRTADFSPLPHQPLFSTDADVFLGQKTRRISGGGRVWSNLYYGDTRLKPKGEDLIKPSFYGIQLGYDANKSHGVYSSYFFNVNQSKVDTSDFSSVIDNYMIGYGKFIYLSVCHFTFTGSIGYDNYKIDGGENKGDGLQTNLFSEFGLDLLLGQWAFKPFYALQYDFLYHGNLGERTHWNRHGLTQLFGSRLNWKPTHALELQSRVIWVHEMLDNPPPFYHMRFSPVAGVNSPAIMYYEGNTGRDWAWFGIGGKFECVFNVYLFLDYDLLLNERHTTHLGSAGVCFGW
ncbi:MAG: autotransporter outer membrane beta-barrel domain-containing protein [Planctomycetaceae bacterium]|nr:autotransporter outer membrane beta-barrel domain-containing protein [Planctomycetaceae bacterium]